MFLHRLNNFVPVIIVKIHLAFSLLHGGLLSNEMELKCLSLINCFLK